MATQAGTAAPFASASLYVGDLLPEVTEALLFEMFNAVGPVNSVRVCRDAATRRSLGYAYVNFHRVEDAERALDTMNFKDIRNQPCRIMWSHRDPGLRKSGLGNIFVKNLAKTIDHKTLYDTFSMFGNILSCKVAQNSKFESLGYGFVHYESEESARNAIERVDGKVIAGQQVSVAPFKSKKERGGENKFSFTNVYVKNLPAEYSKEDLDKLFSQYGQITSSVCKNAGTSSFGFINFNAPEDAAAAIESLNQTTVGAEEKKLFVGRAQKKEEREKELRDRFEQMKIERQQKYAGVNLYVKNLADTVGEDQLREEFSKFGDISSCVIMRDNEKSKGFGFVCYTTTDEATKAVTEMNGRMLSGKPLYVALAQRKETRRAQLEAQYAARAKLGMQQPQMGGMYPQGAPIYYQYPQRMAYPQQMMPARRWNPNQGVPPMMRNNGGVNYQLMPAVNNRGGQARRGRGPRGAQQGKGNRMPQQAQGQNFKYTDNVRNRNQQPAQQPAQQPVQAAPAQQDVVPTMAPASEPLTIKDLAAAPEAQQKRMIGERLYPLIHARQPQLAGKITGMLLEMANGELIHLLESETALIEKIEEALAVLKKAAEDQ